MDVVKGKDVLLEVWDSSLSTPAYVPFKCLRDVDITLTAERINTTTNSSSYWNTYKNRRIDYDITLSGVTTVWGDGWHAFQSFEVDNIFSGYNIRLTFTDTAGAAAVFTCGVLIDTVSVTGNQDDFSTFDETLKGNGAYTLTRNGAPSGFLLSIGRLDLRVTATTSTSITLAWKAVLGETSFLLEWSLDNVSWTTLATPAANSITYTHTGLTPNTQYYYRIKAIGGGLYRDSGWSYTSAPTLPVGLTQLLTPVLTATPASNTQINLTWNDVANESSYQLERSLGGVTWAVITNPAANATSYNNTGLTADTQHFYRLMAVGDNVTFSNSGYSYANARTTGGVPVTFTAEWNFYEENPYADMVAGLFLASGSVDLSLGGSITVDTTVMPMDWYLVVRYPSTESNKTIWFNTSFNNGTIPDYVFRSIVTVGGYKYIISKNPSSFDSSAQTTFS